MHILSLDNICIMDFHREFICLQFTQARDAFDKYTVRTKFQIIFIYLHKQLKSKYNSKYKYMLNSKCIQ